MHISVHGTKETTGRLIRKDGIRIGAAVQASTVSNNDYKAAKLYLSRYTQPHGNLEKRAYVSTIESRHRLKDVSNFCGDSFSAPGSKYDYDRLCDPAQHVDMKGTTVRDLARNVVVEAKASHPEEIVCALYDFTKRQILYAYNHKQYSVKNYWASAAETWVSKRGDCACQAIFFGSLCEGVGLTTRLVCIPNHAFVQVLMPSVVPHRISRWYTSGHVRTRRRGVERLYPRGSGCNYYVTPKMAWLVCDLTMCNHAGARASAMPPAGTAGTAVLRTEGGGWDYPDSWKQKKGGRSVTYRYATNEGTRFEWMVDSAIDGGGGSGRGLCFGGASVKEGIHKTPESNEYAHACDIFSRSDADESGFLEADEIERLLLVMARAFLKKKDEENEDYERRAKALMREAVDHVVRDTNGDDAISFSEFYDSWTKLKEIADNVGKYVSHGKCHYSSIDKRSAIGMPLCATSEVLCRVAARALGLKLGGFGYPFAAKTYKTKGLYAYKSGRYRGMAFYGRSEGKAEKVEPCKLPKFRPTYADLRRRFASTGTLDDAAIAKMARDVFLVAFSASCE
eukprot:g1122.t1